MPGKTISAHADEETARLLEHIARVEDRSPSQLVAAALTLYVRLPTEAHASLRYLQALGTPDDFARMTREVARAMLNARHEISERRFVEAMQVEGADRLHTEEDIAAEAVRLTTSRRQETRRRPPGKQAADTAARTRRPRG